MGAEKLGQGSSKWPDTSVVTAVWKKVRDRDSAALTSSLTLSHSAAFMATFFTLCFPHKQVTPPQSSENKSQMLPPPLSPSSSPPLPQKTIGGRVQSPFWDIHVGREDGDEGLVVCQSGAGHFGNEVHILFVAGA